MQGQKEQREEKTYGAVATVRLPSSKRITKVSLPTHTFVKKSKVPLVKTKG